MSPTSVNRLPRIRSASLLASVLLASQAPSAFAAPFLGQGRAENFGFTRRQHVDTPAEKRRRELYNARMQAAEPALARKDYASAEREFRAARAIDAFDPFFDLNYARLYDAQGRLREAMAAYGKALGPHERAVSSIQDDARLLARYGDLCLRFGRRAEARAAFLKAIPPRRPRMISDARSPSGREIPDPSYVPTPPDASDRTLRSMAHLGAAARFWSHGDDANAEREVAIAVQADPSSWLARLRFAEAKARRGDRQGAMASLAVADRLAKGTSKAAVAEVRDRYRLDDSVTVVTIKDGKAIVTHRPNQRRP